MWNVQAALPSTYQQTEHLVAANCQAQHAIQTKSGIPALYGNSNGDEDAGELNQQVERHKARHGLFSFHKQQTHVLKGRKGG